jgi:hypothetical protein
MAALGRAHRACRFRARAWARAHLRRALVRPRQDRGRSADPLPERGRAGGAPARAAPARRHQSAARAAGPVPCLGTGHLRGVPDLSRQPGGRPALPGPARAVLRRARGAHGARGFRTAHAPGARASSARRRELRDQARGRARRVRGGLLHLPVRRQRSGARARSCRRAAPPGRNRARPRYGRAVRFGAFPAHDRSLRARSRAARAALPPGSGAPRRGAAPAGVRRRGGGSDFDRRARRRAARAPARAPLRSANPRSRRAARRRMEWRASALRQPQVFRLAASRGRVAARRAADGDARSGRAHLAPAVRGAGGGIRHGEPAAANDSGGRHGDQPVAGLADLVAFSRARARGSSPPRPTSCSRPRRCAASSLSSSN